jgi:predicted transcriptional regulator
MNVLGFWGQTEIKQMMLSKEFLILDHLCTRPQASQRELAMGCGISLGRTNAIIKDLVTKGLLRCEEQNGRKVSYILTQRGLAERARLSNENILSTIRNYRRIKDSVMELLNRLYGKGYREFVLEGDKGEIHDVITEIFDNHFKDRATLMWGPAETREAQIILNMDRRFLTDKNAVNILHEITV